MPGMLRELTTEKMRCHLGCGAHCSPASPALTRWLAGVQRLPAYSLSFCTLLGRHTLEAMRIVGLQQHHVDAGEQGG